LSARCRDAIDAETTTKEAKDLQVGDVQVQHAGMVRYKVIAVTPIGNGGYVEVKC
jgi:hypothetical protein